MIDGPTVTVVVDSQWSNPKTTESSTLVPHNNLQYVLFLPLSLTRFHLTDLILVKVFLGCYNYFHLNVLTEYILTKINNFRRDGLGK